MILAKESHHSGSHGVRCILMTAFLGFLALTITFAAQTKPAATFADYGQWETLGSAGSYGGLSPDGQWLTYAINRSNGKNELRIIKLADNTTKVIAFGVRPVFSSDSKWTAYSIGYSEDEREKMKKEKKPVPNKLGVLNLATGKMATLEGIESFAFSSDGAFLAMQKYKPERPSNSGAPSGQGGRGTGRGGSEAPEETPGTTLIVRQLANGRDTSFGNEGCRRSRCSKG